MAQGSRAAKNMIYKKMGKKTSGKKTSKMHKEEKDSKMC